MERLSNQSLEYLFAVIMWLGVYFSPTFPLIWTIGFFVFCDTITGVMAAYKRGEKIESRKLKNTVMKFAAYGIGISVAHVIEQRFISDFPAMKVVSGFIAYIEIKSMNENIESITGVNIFKSILDKFKIK